MTLQLPDPIATFFAIDDDSDATAVAACFTPDAEVRDEGETHRGGDAILAWRRAARRKYAFRAEPRELRQDGDILTVRAQVTGDFPGSPAMLDHVFTLRDGRIAALEIH
ncbi:nuclear transport factor 2 family protein [Coralloluteibacterium thermophilus]|uniref:Nuclear transport factor 2 family protein n=1 Tax=Coralloluteibacterium thermophilum TaxID=2707049 RepID=A0ABV9NLJ7_9GAMM